MASVEINNQTKNRAKISFLRIFLYGLMSRTGQDLDLSVALVSPATIKKLNKKYRRLDKVTDVLSFEKINEIIICLDRAKKQAKEQNLTIDEELKNLLAHGYLHLIGYDHKTDTQEKKMNKKLASLIKNL
ncbi:MAG: rRNA maturation RNase YbeY [Patescibacteria group bacterium]|nr:rRNA maturation RNase YbeY [Patescibacteria group bacterium]MDD5121443.1 rRNA maturation RNase YbeY [Patescibacteria group bacterium]MDD5222197.1 rRNA maturation RNase YbeY [Patescibacteria group bacterium]MDD5396395.1 rRNA maturation RNase YbeY [Patescibacteria group bacterium]